MPTTCVVGRPRGSIPRRALSIVERDEVSVHTRMLAAFEALVALMLAVCLIGIARLGSDNQPVKWEGAACPH